MEIWKEESVGEIQPTPIVVKGSRDTNKCFTNGQRIRHIINGIDKDWIGVYDSSMNGIMYDEKFYKSLSGFSEKHYSIDRPDRVKCANGWKENVSVK